MLKCSALVILIDFSLTVKAATLKFISGRGSAISSAKEGESGFIYNLVTPPFHWTALLLQFEVLVKMTRIATETAGA